MSKQMQDKLLSRGKDRSRSEMEKLREMDFKKKCEYIWEYYRYFIIGSVIGLIILFNLLNTWVFNPPPDTGLFIAWDAGFVDHERIDALSNILTDNIEFEAEDDIADVSLFFTGVDDAQLAMAHTQRMVAMLAAGAIDVFVLDSQSLANSSYAGVIIPLDPLLEAVEIINPDIYARIMSETAYALHSSDGETFSEQIMGIRLMDSPLLTELGLINSDWYWLDWYFSIAASGGNLENAAQALIIFFE